MHQEMEYSLTASSLRLDFRNTENTYMSCYTQNEQHWLYSLMEPSSFFVAEQLNLKHVEDLCNFFFLEQI